MKLLASALALSLGILALAPSPAYSAMVGQVQGESVAGTWVGSFGGQGFTIEIVTDGGVTSGRYQITGDSGWVDLEEVSHVDGVLRFQLRSRTPAPFIMRLDDGGDKLVGTYNSASFPPIPVTFTRAS